MNRTLSKLVNPPYVVITLFTITVMLMVSVLTLWYRFVRSELGPHVVLAEPLSVSYVGEMIRRNQNDAGSDTVNERVQPQEIKTKEQQIMESCNGAIKRRYTFLVTQKLFGDYDDHEFTFDLLLERNCKPLQQLEFDIGNQYLMIFDRPSAGIYRLRNSTPVMASCEGIGGYAITGESPLQKLNSLGLPSDKLCVCSRMVDNECLDKKEQVKGVRISDLKDHLVTLGAMQPQQYLNSLFNFEDFEELLGETAGLEKATCRNWRLADPNFRADVLSWVAGFTTAVNEYAPNRNKENRAYRHFVIEVNKECARRYLESKNNNGETQSEQKLIKEIILERFGHADEDT